ncbi:transmembrane protein, putative [Bodo saltans]|uniref:Transmembrane protein, putative n=1 Tax=Bodo saltans TaxID=75058 RepID=A0A0S4KE11_BODSA|nr:transmembrane protein, putative [Bodo saltans]|eukprot:CUI11721.1 transmembrane protein, putative [Bodo saltans]
MPAKTLLTKGLAQRGPAGGMVGFGSQPNLPAHSSSTSSFSGVGAASRKLRGAMGRAGTTKGLLLSVVGFVLFVWIILTAMRVEKRSSSSGVSSSAGGARRGSRPSADGGDDGGNKRTRNNGDDHGGNGIFQDDDGPGNNKNGGVIGEEQKVSDDKLASLLRNGAASASATSLYCDPSVHRNQADMRELAHRGFTIPLDEIAPVVVQPVVVEERVHQAFQKSLDQLLRERVHDWHYVLEGAKTTPEGQSVSTLLTTPFTNLDIAGFYCLSVRDEVDNCIVASIPFSVLDKKREGSEYAVAPVRLVHRTMLYGTIAKAVQAAAEAAGPVAAPASPADHKQRSSLFRLKDVTLMYSKYFPLRSVSPVVVQIPSVLEAFYQQNDFSSHHDEFLHHSLTVAQRHVSINGGDYASATKIDIEYGRGSFWLVPGETYSFLRTALAKKDRRFLDALRVEKQSSEVVKRAAFEHYASMRSILLSPNPDEDEPVATAEGEDDDHHAGVAGGGAGDNDRRDNNKHAKENTAQYQKRMRKVHDMEKELVDAVGGRQLLSVREDAKDKQPVDEDRQQHRPDDVVRGTTQITEPPPTTRKPDFGDPNLPEGDKVILLSDEEQKEMKKRLQEEADYNNHVVDGTTKKPKRKVRNALEKLHKKDEGTKGEGEARHELDHNARDGDHDTERKTRAPLFGAAGIKKRGPPNHDTHHHRRTPQMMNYTVPFLVDNLEVHGVPEDLMLVPRDLNQLLTMLHTIENGRPCMMLISWTVRIHERLRVERGCVFVFAGDRSQIVLEKGADVVLAGESPTEPILLTSVDAGSLWGGIVVEAGASLTLKYTMIHLVGSSGVTRVPGTGSHIKRHAPAITLSPSSTASSPSSSPSKLKSPPSSELVASLVMEDSAILNCDGSGFALGKGSRAGIHRTLVQDVAQGGECVSCHINISYSHFMDFPFVSNLSLAFVDGDNDAFYFRGGHASVTHSVFLNALDDGIDSASTTGDAEHSTLTLNHVAIENCQHEGVALSGSKGTQRTVTIENSLITVTQQAIENGHTPIKHRALVRNTVLYRNHIAIRNGDNYPTLDVFGKVRAEHCLLIANSIPVLDWVEIDHSKRTNRNTYYDPKRYAYEVHNPLLGESSHESSADVMLPLLTLADCLIDQKSSSSPAPHGNEDGASASVGSSQAPEIDRHYYESGLIVPLPANSAENTAAGGDPALHLQGDQQQQKEVRHGASRRYSSADLGKGLFCGRAHFVVEGTITTNQDPWRR